MKDEQTPDGSNLEQYLLACWGRDGRVGWIIIQEFLDLAKEHGYDNVYRAIKIAAEANVRNVRYVKGILAKEKKKSEPRKRLRIECTCGTAHYIDEDCPHCRAMLPDISIEQAKAEIAALMNQVNNTSPK